jgi:hypothetical protein
MTPLRGCPPWPEVVTERAAESVVRLGLGYVYLQQAVRQ